MNSDRFNPILVREIRQMVRNRQVVMAINLYLLGLIVFMGISISHYLQGMIPPDRFGTLLFSGIVGVTAATTAIGVIGYSAIRVATDRINEDLLFFSGITPAQNVLGRLECGMVFSLLLFSMSVPFLTVAYLFRGVEFWLYAMIIPILFVAVQALNLVALAIFSAVRTPLQFICYLLLFVFALWPIFWLAMLTAYVFSGVFTGRPLHFNIVVVQTLTGWSSVAVLVAMLFLSFVVIPATAFLFARCNLSPFSANRMRPIRLWLSGVVVGSFLLCLLVGSFYRTLFREDVFFALFYIWVPGTVGILSFMLVLAVCERESWEGRLRREIPVSGKRRLLVFPFYTGSINGLFWVFLGLFFLIACISIFSMISPVFSFQGILWTFPLMMAMIYVFNCSMTAMGLWKRLLRRWIPRDMIWMLAGGMMIVTVLAVLIVAICFSHIPNFDEILLHASVALIILWFLATVALSYSWLRNRFIDFTPSVDDEAATFE